MEFMIEESGLTSTAIGVRWERVLLEIDLQLTNTEPYEDLTFYAVNGLGQARAKFEILSVCDDKYTLRSNITNNGHKRCWPKGTYRIYVCSGENVLAETVTSPDIVDKLGDYSRQFKFNARKKSYDVFFDVEDNKEILPFRIITIGLGETNIKFPRTGSFRKLLKKAFGTTIFSFNPMVRRAYRVFSRLNRHKRSNTILFMSEQSDTLGANLVAVSDRMKERGLDENYTLKYSSYKRSKAKTWDNAKKQLKELWLISGSGLIFLDDHAPLFDWMKLNGQQVLIQLWHAGAGFKSSGYSRFGHIGSPSPQSCHRQYKYGIAGSRNIAHFFSEVWGINTENVLPTGMPRMDEYLDEEHRAKKTKELYELFPAAKEKKVILFAPTYRGTNNKNAYYPYDRIDFEKLYELCGDEYVVFFKMHPWVIEDIDIEEQYADKFFDVKNYPVINDLFYITELLITDYSSSIFEFSLMRRPMLFFAYDEIQYSFSRGFHRPYRESAPGKVVTTFDELLEAIKNKDFEYEKVEEYIEKHFDYIDSHASDRVIDWFILGQMPEEFKERIEKKDEEVKELYKLNFKKPKEVSVEESNEEINEDTDNGDDDDDDDDNTTSTMTFDL